MALSITRLKEKYKAVLLNEATQNQMNLSDHTPILEAIDRISEGLAKATIEEIKSSKIVYLTGLSAPPTGGVVVGTFNHTIL